MEKNAMTSPERIKRAAAGRETDRVPFFFRAERLLAERLARELNLPGAEAVPLFFETDIVQVFPVYKTGNLRVAMPEGELPPLEKIGWPDASVLDAEVGKAAILAARETGTAVCGGVWASVFTQARHLLGEETFLVALYEEPEYIRAFLARLTESYLDVNRVYLEKCAKYLDLFYFGSDFGTQRCLFISPAHFREFFKPCLARLVKQAKDFGLPVMYHTCGNVSDIVGDLAEIGVDILDPVQVSANGMTPEELRRFKGKIGFCGGVSTQDVLPFGSPEDVRRAFRRLVQTLGPEGLIAAPDQDMIGDVPTENVAALFDPALRGYMQ